jgi:endonuclease/exonuclease/phosphatase family metal-dependent hydrolase
MKYFLVLLLLLSSLQADFKVASWNLKNVSINSLLFKKSIGKINKYIESNKDFDVICLQELRDKQIIYFLSGGVKEIFFSPFERIVSNYKGKGTHKEVYGFLVNKKYKDIKKVEFKNYRSFKRPPTVVILDKKIAVVNVHLVYGKSVSKRKKELRALKRVIKKLTKTYKIKKENIILAGDFNLTYKNMKKVFKQVWVDGKTTVGTKKLSKDYDHFVTFNRNGSAKVRTDILKDYKFYRKNISDHLPIELVLKSK